MLPYLVNNTNTTAGSARLFPTDTHPFPVLLFILAENAFTAGMLTGQQLQHAATMAHPPTALPAAGRLMPLIEGKPQHHDLNDFTPGAPTPLGRVFSAPAAPVGDPAAASASASADDGSGAGVSSSAGKLLERLPGGKRALQWLKGGRSDSWRKQQEQLQRDKYDVHQVRYLEL